MPVQFFEGIIWLRSSHKQLEENGWCGIFCFINSIPYNVMVETRMEGPDLDGLCTVWRVFGCQSQSLQLWLCCPSKICLYFKIWKQSTKVTAVQQGSFLYSLGYWAIPCCECGKNLWEEKGQWNSIGVRCLLLQFDLPRPCQFISLILGIKALLSQWQTQGDNFGRFYADGVSP